MKHTLALETAMNVQPERDGAAVPLAHPFAQSVGVQLHPDANAVNSFFVIERMETFVGPATAARKRLQINVKLQLQQAPRVVRASPGSTGD